MNDPLRNAWTNVIRLEDYEAHMAAVGQAQANAHLVENYFCAQPLANDSSVLFVGAGTGQMFQFVAPDFLLPFELTFTDINPGYLNLLAERLHRVPSLRYITIVDDIEGSQLAETFSLVIAVLVLEHVNWEKAVATLTRLAAKNVLVVIQENPLQQSTAINLQRPIVGTMNVFVDVHPQLIPRAELVAEFKKYGFAAVYNEDQTVADAKKMLALGFQYNK